MSDQQPPSANLTEQLIRLNVAVENMVKQAEAVHKRLDKAGEDREEIQKEVHGLQLALNDVRNDVKNHLRQCATHEEAPQDKPAKWQGILTPPVIIAGIFGAVLIVALIFGRDEAVAPLVDKLPIAP